MEDFDDADNLPLAIPAATLVVFRRDPAGGAAQVLLLERSGAMRFAGGATVFPGGRIDRADYDLAERVRGDLDLDDAAARVAAIRETLEESGLAIGLVGNVTAETAVAARRMLIERGTLAPVLEAFGWQLALDRLTPFARWLPKHRAPRIFDTRFYIADLGTGAVDVAVDATENTHLFWASAREALRLADLGEIQVIFPTRRNLERLAQFDDFAACLEHARTTPVVTITPAVAVRDGARWLTIPEDAGYPVHAEPIDSAMRG